MRDGFALWHPSPNFGPRRDGLTPRLIVLHYTAMPSAVAARDWLCAPEAQVSAHYVLARSGALWQLVDEEDRAWHAGAGGWNGQGDVNSRSIGVEVCNTGSEPYPEPQMQALEALVGRIMARWGIPPEGVIGHSDCAPGRKIDPGPRFDWGRLAAAGLARAPGARPEPADWPRFRALAQAQGYGAEVPDATLLAAVRLRYRPGATGSLQPDDLAVLA